MDKPVNHYGDIIIAVCGIGLLIALVYFLRVPLQDALTQLVQSFTTQGKSQIDNINNFVPTASNGPTLAP